MELSCYEELTAQELGYEVLKYLKETGDLKELERKTETKALQVLEEIRRVLNDDSLDDPACFQRIEAIVNTLEANGVHTTRHDW